MKIRKILPLLLLAIGSVFMLSSCDAMLDAIFSNNTIGVEVAVSVGTYRYYPGFDQVSVSVVGPTLASANASYIGNDGSYMYWTVTLPKLSNGTYTVTIGYYSFYYGASQPSQFQYVSLPSGSSHSASLNFVYY
jgi:hypothetical protein